MTTETPIRKSRRLRNLLLAAILGLFPIYFGLAFFKGVEDGNKFAHPTRAALCCTPANANLDYEDVTFTTDDGLTLRGWYLPSQNSAAILMMHGIHSNRESVFGVAEMLHRHGYGILIFDARAHGESDGDRLNNVHLDGVAAAAYLKGRPEIEHIGAWGFSLGGLMILQAAAQTPNIEAVIADGAGPSAYQDLPPRRTFGEWLYLTYDIGFFLAFDRSAGGVAPISTTQAAAQIAPRPLLLIATDQPLERAITQSFYDAADEPKTLWYIPDVGHGGGFGIFADDYEARITAFFDAALLN